MAGGYAHITAVSRLSETETLLDLFPRKVAGGLLTHYKFMELGSVSPDYPYLGFASVDSLFRSGDAPWADAMHNDRGGEMIRAGIRLVRAMSGDSQVKCLAWLLGYAAHVGTDLTIHPMVNLMVGAYAQNKTQHRVCEMNQDGHVYATLGLGKVIDTRHLDATIGKCGDGKGGLDADIKALWAAMLRAVHGTRDSSTLEKRIDSWHTGFVRALSLATNGGAKLFPFARHMLADKAAVYPDPPDAKWLTNLKTPKGPMDYAAIYDRVLTNVQTVWRSVGAAVLDHDDTALAAIGPDWNLDTGEATPGGALVFWS